MTILILFFTLTSYLPYLIINVSINDPYKIPIRYFFNAPVEMFWMINVIKCYDCGSTKSRQNADQVE